jgi:hypothetical protein
MAMSHHLAATLFAGVLLAGARPAQLSPAPGSPSQLDTASRTWSRTYGGSSSQQGLFDLRQLSGGRLAVAGYTGSFGLGQAAWLMRLDLVTGDVRFERVTNSAAQGFTDGAAIAADGGALFMGRDVVDLFVKHDAWVVRVDRTGAVEWSQGFAGLGMGRYFLYDAAELADGSWIAVGATSVFDFPPQHAWVVRLDAAGGLLWQYEYGGGVTETARAVTPTSDGGFALAGWTNSSGAGSDDVWVLKIDAAGAIQWQKTLGGLESDQAEDVVELGDGSLAVIGSTNSLTPSGHAPWVLRLSSAGALLWHKVVADDVWGDLGAGARTQDGQLIVVGRVGEPGFPSNDLWSAKLAVSDGKVAWQRAYEGQTGDFGSAVLPLAGSGYVLGGTWGWGFEGESIWLERADATGGLSGCDIVRSTAFAPISPPITVQNGTALRLEGSAHLQPVAADVASSDAVVTDICR